MRWDKSDKKAFYHDLYITMALLIGSSIWLSYTVFTLASKVKKVNNWVPTKCVIDSIYVDTDHWSEPAVFFWNTHYSYEYNGREYTSNRYNIIKKHRIVTEEEKERIKKEKYWLGYMHKPRGPYSPGEETVCFVNPDSPKEAVLDRQHPMGIFAKDLFLPCLFLITNSAFLILFIRTFRY